MKALTDRPLIFLKHKLETYRHIDRNLDWVLRQARRTVMMLFSRRRREGWLGSKGGREPESCSRLYLTFARPSPALPMWFSLDLKQVLKKEAQIMLFAEGFTINAIETEASGESNIYPCLENGQLNNWESCVLPVPFKQNTMREPMDNVIESPGYNLDTSIYIAELDELEDNEIQPYPILGVSFPYRNYINIAN